MYMHIYIISTVPRNVRNTVPGVYFVKGYKRTVSG